MKELRPALVALLAFAVLTGVLYPLLVMGVGKVAFAHQANGSLIEANGTVVGSELIGQAFTDPGYFWGRPSALGPFPYNAMNSTGTNHGPLNPALHDAVAERIQKLRDADPGNDAKVPVDLITASSSGLDPHISPAAAYYQAGRIARVRGMSVEDVRALIASHIEDRTLGILGEPRVNVVLINRALDARSGSPPR